MSSKPFIIRFIAILGFSFGISVTIADEWPSIEKKEFKSRSGKYVFVITPHEDWPDHPGHCKGVLFKINGGKLTEVWSRYLINNVGPVHVFVTDSGRYVVTMDEWHRVGKLPVVIYGFRGDLIYVHNIKSLGLEDDIEHIKMTISSYWWNEDAIIFFGPKEEYLFIRLHWGKMLVIELWNGELCDKNWHELNRKKWKKLHNYGKKKTEEIALAKLNSPDPDERKTGALIVGQLKIRKAIPRLKELLCDKAYYTTQSGDDPSMIILYVRKAAKEALDTMGEKVDNTIIELKEKGHLRYDPNSGKYVVVFDN
jgi:hypothetical protein